MIWLSVLPIHGYLLQKEQTDNKVLKKKIEDMEKSVKDMQDKFE